MIFISGHHNTGKSTIAKWLIPLGFSHLETGEIIRRTYSGENSKCDFYNWVSQKNLENKDYLDNLIVQEVLTVIKNNPSVKLIITGNRQINGINYLKKRVGEIDNKKDLILFLHAPEEELYRRQLERTDRIIPNLTFDVFKNKYLAYDEKMGVNLIEKEADYVLENLRDDKKVKDRIIEILKANLYLD